MCDQETCRRLAACLHITLIFLRP